ncbi:MAG: hypothetical protein HQK56_16635 [Deltaproteobacteria bacterium]|nr:hypothetical protein [Deltaproteobacteria bacterium]
MTPTIKFEVARGWQSIALMMQCSISTAKRRAKDQGLPIINEFGTPVLINLDYLDWLSTLRKDPKHSFSGRKRCWAGPRRGGADNGCADSRSTNQAG